MAKNQSQTYTLKINAELSDLQNTLSTAKKQLSSFMSSGKAPEGLEKAFSKINTLLGELSDKAGKPLDFKGLTNAGKKFDTVQENFKAIVRLLGDFSNLSDDVKLSFLKPEDQQQIKAITSSLEEYGKKAAETAKKIKALESAQKDLNKSKSNVEKIEKNVSSLSGRKTKKEADLSGKEARLSALQGMENANPEKIAKLQGEIASLKIEIDGLGKDLEKANKELETSQQAYKKSASSVEILSKEIENASSGSLDQFKQQVSKLGISLEGLDGKEAADQFKILKERLDQLKNDTLKNAESSFNQITMGCKEAGDAAENLSNDAKEAAVGVQELNEVAGRRDSFEAKIKSFLGLSGAAQVLRSALKDAMQTISELDKVMGQMAVVTDLTVGDYWKQLPEYSQRASDLGVSISEAYEAATLYYQQGLKTNEVNELSVQTLKMASIAGLDAADATDRMTAALRGFNMELNEANAQRISDVYSELAAITASDVDEISTAMTKTASIASSAGMEFETTAAFLSQIIETTRESAETAGTAMKTVIARFQELKKDPSEIGEVEGEIVDANAIETALRSVGVSLRDAGGQFRELDDVFLELSSKWDSLDKNTQRYIATIAAGSRQQSRFIAMMQDYGRTQELVASANNSAGASQKQFEKTTETLQYKIENLKNAWHEFTMGIMDSELVKTGVDILTKFLEIVNKATSGLNGIGGSLNKILSVVAVFKVGQKIFERLKEPLIDFFSEIVKRAGETGEKAGKAAKEGLDKTNNEQQKDDQKTPKTKSGLKEKTGLTSFETGQNKFRAQKGLRDANDRLNKAEANKKEAIKNNNTKAIEEADKEIKKATEDVKMYDDWQKKLGEDGKDAWTNISDGVKSFGQSVANAGIGLSLFGGILSSLGLEEAGDFFAKIGGFATVAGSAISSLGPLITSLVKKLVTGGIVTGTAWIWVTAIALAAVALITAVGIAINNAIKNSPEGKLKAAKEAAETAANAADMAAESYERLSQSLDDLSGKYDALEDLTKGTKEWNRAVQEINNSVLDLVEEYSELASLVKNDGGVLKLDIESSEVQEVLEKAQARQVATKNAEYMANVEVAKAENNVRHKELGAKFTYKDPSNYEGYSSFGDYAKNEQLTGMAIGAAIGAIGGPLGAAIGGMIGGGIGYAIESGQQKRNNGRLGVSSSEEAKAKTDDVAKALAEGKVKTEAELQNYLVGLKVSGDAAEELAKEFWENRDSLREYGNALKTVNEQQSATYAAIASSALQLADTLTMSDEQINQASQIVDDDVAGRLYEEKLKEFEGMSDKDLAKSDAALAAVKKQYGSSATIDKNGKVTYQKDGKDETITLNSDQIKSMIATQYATEKSAEAIEMAPAAIQAIGDVVGSSAIDAMYSASNGGALTKADLDTLQSTLGQSFDASAWNNMSDKEKNSYAQSDEIKAAWNALTKEQQDTLFGGNITKFVDKMAEAVESASDAFEDAKSSVKDFMTADMAKGFQQKLDQVAEMAGGQQSTEMVKAATDALLAGKSDEQKSSIQSRINMADWSNLESLLALQLDLELQYGYTTEQAKAYTSTLAEAAYATSKLDLTVQAFGDLWKATEKINQSMTRLTQFQWEYQRALEGSGDSISDLTAKMLEEYKAQAEGYSAAYDASNDDLAKIYASGATDYKVDLTEFVKLGNEGVDIDKSRLQDAIKSGKISEDEASKWLEKLNNQYSTSQNQLEGLRNTLESIEELEQQGKDAYYELRNMAKEAILDSLQEQIDLQQQTLDVTKDANTKLINKIQEQINDNRQARENAEVEQNIANLQSQLAYLGMDSSGANALEQKALEQQIAQAEQDYQDTLVDQTIQQLADANERAAEQRETQIALSQAQLDAYSLSNEFQQDIDRQLAEMLAADSNWRDTELGDLLAQKFTEGMSTQEAKDWADKIGGSVGLANAWEELDWSTYKETTQNNINNILEKIENLGVTLAKEAKNKEYQAQATKISGYGFDLSDIGISKGTDGSYSGVTSQHGALMTNLQSFAERDSDTSKISQYQAQIAEKKADLESVGEDTKGFDYWTKERFYDLFTQEIAKNGSVTTSIHGKDMEVTSYTDYLEKIANKDISSQTHGSAYDIIGAQMIPASISDFGARKGQGDEISLGLDKDGESPFELGIKPPAEVKEKINKALVDESANGNKHLVFVGEQLYVRRTTDSEDWYKVEDSKSYKGGASSLKNAARRYINQNPYMRHYQTGGLADFTGPAWLDGTPSKPEYILNSAQTERFFSLIDVLESFDKEDKNKKSSGDNYFDIKINVEKIEDDYDVERMADKIRRMIYEDASYRNVNSINLIR